MSELKLEVGKVYVDEGGQKIQILTTSRPSYKEYPVVGMNMETGYLLRYTSVGKISGLPGELSLVKEISELDTFQINDLILVRNNPYDSWSIRHFAGISENGYPMTFLDGRISFTWERKKTFRRLTWNFFKKPTKEQLLELEFTFSMHGVM